MDILRDTNIDFMRYRKFFIAVSTVLIAIGIFAIFVHGKLNVGIDFTGGTQLTLQFSEQPEIEEIRSLLAEAGVPEAQIQRFGEAGANEVMIKTPLADETEALADSEETGADAADTAAAETTETGATEQDSAQQLVIAALDARYNQGNEGFDLNRQGSEALTGLLVSLDPDGVATEVIGGQEDPEAVAYYSDVAESVLDQRAEVGLFASWGQVTQIDGVSPAVIEALQANASLGNYALLAAENVGPQIGRELRRKGVLAVVLSLLGMLGYIWLRFELRFAVGAVVATVHDVLVMLGLYALAGFEFNLTTIAAFLTLVGYSVNDTVVVFDRVRENMRKSRREPLVDVMNASINQTLSRTVLTSGTTLMAVTALLIWGGDVLRGFAFVLAIGILVGTYSSIYVASPFALLWEQYFGADARTRKREAGRQKAA